MPAMATRTKKVIEPILDEPIEEPQVIDQPVEAEPERPVGTFWSGPDDPILVVSNGRRVI